MKRIRHQEGMTLLMAIIMLIVLTLLALTTFNVGRSNMQVVSNMQQHDEVLAAARETIEEAISSSRLITSPTSVLATPCNALANTRCIDTNGDGVADVVVTLTPKPVCVKAQAIMEADLDLDTPLGQGCMVTQDSQSFGLQNAANGQSLCANSVWEVSAVATDKVTQAQVQLVQGVAVVAKTTQITSSCP